MHKKTLKDDLKLIIQGIEEVHRLQPWAIFTSMLYAFLKSIGPFINIYMSARIIDELLEGKDVNRLIFLVCITIGLNLIIHLLTTGFDHLSSTLRSIAWQNQDMRLNEKIITMDYEHIESPEVHKLRTKISEAENVNGGGIYALCMSLTEMVQGLTKIITSVLLVVKLFKVNSSIGDGFTFINSWIFSYGFIGLIVLVTIITLSLRSAFEKGYFKYFNEFMHLNRISAFYADQASDYNVGKGIRLYNQKPIFIKEVEAFVLMGK